MEAIEGTGFSTVKFPLLMTELYGVVIVIGPDVAPFDTTAVIVVAVMPLIAAGTPLKRTDTAALRLAPLIVTMLPTSPLVGEKPEIVGGGGARAIRGVLPLIRSDVAVIVVVPEATADAMPVELIVAIA